MQIGWRPGSEERRQPILPEAALIVGSMTIFLKEFVRVEVFSRSVAPCHKEKMVTPKGGRIRRRQKTVNEHGEGYPPVIDGSFEGDALLRLISQTVPKAGEGKKDAQYSTETNEGKEVSVITPSNTVVDPPAMVVLCLYAVIANPAMMAPGRPPDVACLTIFGWHVHGCSLHGSRLNHCPFGS